MTYYAYVNGKISPAAEAAVSVNDLGLLRGYAVFDYMRTYNRKPFLIDRHLTRFANSAKTLGLRVPLSEKEIEETIAGLISKGNEKSDVGIRFVLTGGTTSDGITPSSPTFIIIIESLTEQSEELYNKGIKLITHEFQREIPKVKTTNYKKAIQLLPEKMRQDAFEVLYCSLGNILETTRNNFFIFKGDTLITPNENVLPGITRGFVLELAKGKFNIEERVLKVSELKEADEAFITGTTKKILPVVQVDQQTIADGKPGKNSIKLLELFNNYLETH
jgi:branched-subunit amino acid aminotransferase/4-amino-4-deoxychorismate lyase